LFRKNGNETVEWRGRSQTIWDGLNIESPASEELYGHVKENSGHGWLFRNLLENGNVVLSKRYFFLPKHSNEMKLNFELRACHKASRTSNSSPLTCGPRPKKANAMLDTLSKRALPGAYDRDDSGLGPRRMT